ncbi:MAG: hypothetical protein ACJ77N_01255 [Chloroflexota bacterium]
MNRSLSRLVGIVAAMLLVFLLLVPAVAAADPTTRNLLLSTGGDISVPAGEHLDSLVVVDGTATVAGSADSIVVISGTVNLTGGQTNGIVAIESQVSIDATSTVNGDVRSMQSTVTRAEGATVTGAVTDLTSELARASVFVGPALFIGYLAFALAAIVAALALAGLAARQVRSAEGLIRYQPIQSIVTGIVALILIPVVAVLAIVTIVGIPIGIALLIGVLPIMLVAGYLVAGIFIGDLILRTYSSGPPRERPYLAAIIGMLVLDIASFIPLVGGIAGLFGFGAIVLLMWRVLRRQSSEASASVQPAPAVAAG